VGHCIFGISHNKTVVKHKIAARIASRSSNIGTELEFLVLPQITGPIPSIKIDTSTWNLPNDIELSFLRLSTSICSSELK
jgi:hypothetical protein